MINTRLITTVLLLALCGGAVSESRAEEALEMESVPVEDRLKAFEDLVITAKKTEQVTGREADALSDDVAELLEEARQAEESD